MAEFVDKDYLIKWIESRKRLSKMETILFIQDAPTTCLRDVVRCKDCKHWKKCESSLIGEAMCCTGQGSANILKAPTDFCSYGERRDNGT